MKEGMPRPKAQQEKQEQHHIPQALIDEAFESLARLDWIDLPKIENSEEKVDRLTRAVAADLAGVDVSQIKTDGGEYFYGDSMWKDGTIQVFIEETRANTHNGEVEMTTLVTRVAHSQKETPTKKGYLRLKVSPKRFAELKQQAKQAEEAEKERQKKENAYWRERMKNALPAFLAFAQGHSKRQLTPEECEPIAPMIAALWHGKQLSSDERISLVDTEQPWV